MTIEFLSTALLGISLISGLTVEAIKKILDNTKLKYSSNILAIIVSVVISLVVSVIYVSVKTIPVNFTVIMEIVVLMFLSFLVTTIGYDKVVQTIKQFITRKDDTEDNK